MEFLKSLTPDEALGKGIVDLYASHVLDEKKRVYTIPAVEDTLPERL